jgi:hypothetical protein
MMGNRSAPWRHHYVPQFYIRNWAAADGLVWQRSRTPRGVFEDKRVAPRSTGFAKDLYTLHGERHFSAPADPTEIETKLMGKLDEFSAKALNKLIATGVESLDHGEREDWALFMNGLIERSAVRLNEQDKRALEIGNRLAEECLEKLAGEARQRIEGYLDQETRSALAKNIVRSSMVAQLRDANVNKYLVEMQWYVLTPPASAGLSGLDAELITTDAPLLINCGRDNGPIHALSIALNPHLLFFACNTAEPLTSEFVTMLWLSHCISLLMQPCSFVYSATELADGGVIRLRTASEVYMGRAIRASPGPSE